MGSLRLRTQRHAVRLASLAAISICVAASSSVALPPHHKHLANEYACLRSDRPVDIVLSYFKEDLNLVKSKLERLQSHPFIANRGCVHFYTKLSLADDEASRLNATVVVKTHNMGRESGVYLHYILANYNNLPKHVLFLQADVEEIDNVLAVLNRATEQTGFLGLGVWVTCTCDNCNMIPGKLVRIREIWAMVTDYTSTSITVTLTTQPNTIGPLGATVQVSGVSSVGVVSVATLISGLPTTASSWRAVAVSDDGLKMVACAYPGNIWSSTNGGLTWAAQTNSALSAKNWAAVASNADGTKLAAMEFGGAIWLSSNSGGTWTSQPAGTGANAFPATANWAAVALSATGTEVMAAASGGKLWRTATFGGANAWTVQTGAPVTTAKAWASVASSSDGLVYVAGVDSGALVYSNTLNTWTATTGAPASGRWMGIASSANGQLAIAADGTPGNLWQSTNSGATWVALGAGTGAPNSAAWRCVAMSNDGTKRVAVVSAGSIWYSSNSGANWTALSGGLPASAAWLGVTMNLDGSVMAATIDSGSIWVTSNFGANWYLR